MFRRFYPYEYVESVFSIDYQKLYHLGYRGVIFDIDQTLVQHGEDSNYLIDDLFREIQKIGFKTILLSNNSKERVESFIKNIDTPFISNANKPSVENYIQAIAKLDVSRETAVMIGDQLFTDIYGANKSGIANILVEFMKYDYETKIGLRRNIEKIVLNFYKLDKPTQHRLGDILKEEYK